MGHHPQQYSQPPADRDWIALDDEARVVRERQQRGSSPAECRIEWATSFNGSRVDQRRAGQRFSLNLHPAILHLAGSR